MADILDKAILIGLGLEKKAKEALEELEKMGKEGVGKKGAEAGAPAPQEPLSPKQVLENKVVEEGVKTLREFLSLVKSAKEKLGKEVTSSSGKVMEKLNVATHDDIEIIREMARIAREKADDLEKRVEELEKIQREG